MPSATSRARRTSPASITHLLSPRQISADRHTAYDIVFLDLPPDDSPEALPILRERLRDAPGLDVELAGGPAFYGDVQTVSEEDLRRSELISLPLAALALLVVFGSVVAAGVPLIVGGSAVIVALAAIFLVSSVTPMSIFVLNLATLLGLGLGVDYSLLMTSRFREELATRTGSPTQVDDAVRVTVATAGRAVFFSAVTVLLGLLGLILFEFMILRSVGHRGSDRRRPGRDRRADPAAGGADHPRHPHRPTRRPQGHRHAGAGRPVVATGSTGHAPPGRGPHPDARASCCCWAHRSCTSGSTPRTPRSCRRPCRHAPRSIDCSASSAKANSRRSCSRSGPTVPATSRANLAELYDYSRRLAADPSVTRVDSLVDVDRAPHAGPVRPAVRRPERAARSVRGDDPGGHHEGRPDRVHALHAVRPEPGRGQGAGRGDCAIRSAAWHRRPGWPSWSAAGRRTSRTSSIGSRRTSHGRAVHRRQRPTSSCSCSCARSSCRPRRWS